MKRRSPGENFTQSGRGLPLAVVAEICSGVVLTLWVKVFSGRVRVKEVPDATWTISKVLTATKLAPPWLLDPEDVVEEAIGVRLPVASMTTGVPVPDAIAVVVLEVDELVVVDVVDDADPLAGCEADPAEAAVLRLDAVEPVEVLAVLVEDVVELAAAVLRGGVTLVVTDVPVDATAPEELIVTRVTRGGMTATVTVGTTASCCTEGVDAGLALMLAVSPVGCTTL